MRKVNFFKRPATAGCAALLLLCASLAHAQTRDLATQGAPLDRIAAVVNDGVVLASSLDDETALIAERLQAQKLELPPQNVLRQQVLERLIVEEIQMQRASRVGIKIPDEALNNAITEIAQRNNLTLSKFPDALAAQGIDYASYREDVRRELTLTLLRQRDVLQRINVTPKEIDQYLDREAKHPAVGSEYNISHILIAVPESATPAQLDAASKRAQDVYDRAKGGEDFAKLAVSYSNSQTALEGGALGWRKGTELPTVLADVVLKLKPGEVSEPLRAPTGFHIIKLNQVRGVDEKVVIDQVHARHILMRTNELQDDATVRQKLEQIRARILKGEDFAGLAQTSSEDPGSASDGGDLGWTSPGAFDPEFEKVLGSLKEGEISEPFHTQFGWHIVQLMARRHYDSTDELKRKRAADAIRASKADEETELWLRRMRDDAYVEIKL
ncbi:MAG TPA: peptidylprolyl isomerase SurA [Steroidobacteraceae bacterium]|nr:peptidylprolyl isomerase SurA [Steroidobacteraceae bacterium]